MNEDTDKDLAIRHGSYASYSTEDDPVFEHYGDGSAEEVDRLLDKYAAKGTRVLDLGCGAGFTLSRLAPHVAEIWGFDLDRELLSAAQQRVTKLGLKNAKLVLGNVAIADEVGQLPENTFDLVLSRRGPNVNGDVLRTLEPDAFIVQELALGTLGLQPLFGRAPFLPHVGSNPHGLIEQYAWLGFLPVSVKDYFYDAFYRDAEHLSHDLGDNMLGNWMMPDAPYDEARDRAALDLYVRYNTTSRGIRVTHHRSVYLFRRATIHRFPAIPEARPLY